MHLTCFQSSITICVDGSHGQHDLRGQGMTESSHHSARTSRSVLPTVKTLKYPYLTYRMKVHPQYLFTLLIGQSSKFLTFLFILEVITSRLCIVVSLIFDLSLSLSLDQQLVLSCLDQMPLCLSIIVKPSVWRIKISFYLNGSG